MTTTEVLAFLRRKLSQVDTSTSVITDPELLAAISDRRRDFALRKLQGFSDLAVGYDQSETTTYGILPEPTEELGTLLALGAAVDLLNQTFLGRLDRGELGTTWTSGFESESTVTASRAYQGLIGAIENELQAHKLIKRGPTSGERTQ